MFQNRVSARLCGTSLSRGGYVDRSLKFAYFVVDFPLATYNIGSTRGDRSVTVRFPNVFSVSVALSILHECLQKKGAHFLILPFELKKKKNRKEGGRREEGVHSLGKEHIHSQAPVAYHEASFAVPAKYTSTA